MTFHLRKIVLFYNILQFALIFWEIVQWQSFIFSEFFYTEMPALGGQVGLRMLFISIARVAEVPTVGPARPPRPGKAAIGLRTGKLPMSAKGAILCCNPGAAPPLWLLQWCTDRRLWSLHCMGVPQCPLGLGSPGTRACQMPGQGLLGPQRNFWSTGCPVGDRRSAFWWLFCWHRKCDYGGRGWSN